VLNLRADTRRLAAAGCASVAWSASPAAATAARRPSAQPRARPGRLSGLSVLHTSRYGRAWRYKPGILLFCKSVTTTTGYGVSYEPVPARAKYYSKKTENI
jgi:hypothetical protein